ncbi:MAG: hypothetical protein ABEI75_00255 [Halobaculum sp.]
MPGLADYLPRRGWAIVLTLLFVAVVSLVVPSAVGPPRGEAFVPFFWIVSGIQLVTALGIAGTVVHYRDPDREPSEWKYDP